MLTQLQQELSEKVHQLLLLTPLCQDEIRQVLEAAATKLEVRFNPTWDNQLQVHDSVVFQDAAGKTQEGYVSGVHITEAGPGNSVQLHYTFITDAHETHEVEHISGKFFQK